MSHRLGKIDKRKKRDDFEFSFDCAINGAKDDRFPAESDQLTPMPIVIETNDEISDDEAQQNTKAKKVWLILFIILVFIVGYAFDYGSEINLVFVGPFAFLCGSIVLCWLCKPAQRGLLLRIWSCFCIRNN